MTDNSKSYVICIDLGTSGCKAALYSLEGECAGIEFSPVQLHLIPGGGAEQEPQDWWRAITEATRKLLHSSSILPDDITAISVNTQWSGTVPVDKSGKHLANAIIWLDSRGAEEINKRRKGIINISGFGATKILRWIRLTGGAPANPAKTRQPTFC